MLIRRVFIVWSYPLFRETVRLLLKHPAVEIVGASSKYEEALAAIEELRPDTIIVEETEDVAVVRIEALQFLKAFMWGPRVIRLSLQDNELWVYSRERRVIGDSTELLQLVRDS
jgi:DNA-binding NarL/FixJ family response regulator